MIDDGGTPADSSDDSITVGTTAIAEARLAFLRGDTTNDGQGYGFRNRNSRLGDIVHGGSIYVSEPEVNWPDGLAGTSPYSAFASTHKGREAIVYVGANDGMLHGFRASDGEEVIAYVPG